MERRLPLTDWKTQGCEMLVLPALIYSFRAEPLRVPSGLFTEIDRLTLKFTGRFKGPRTAKQSQKRRTKLRTHTF